MSKESFNHSLFNISNLFTASNLLCGIVAIICTLSGRIEIAPFLIFLGAIFDFFDGFLARKLNVSSELGKELDSLADMITFGLAPGIFMMVVLIFSIYIDGPFYSHSFVSHVHFQLQNWTNAVFYGVPNNMDASIKYLPFIALVIPFFSMFRLAKFNLDKRQTDSFIGVPTPLNTLFFSFFPLILWVNFDQLKTGNWYFSWMFDTYFLAILIVLMSSLLISEIPLFSLKFKTLTWRGNQIRYVFLVASLCFILTIHIWSIPLIVFLHVILSVIETYIKRKSNEI
jgi:CDP-diacylglycerol--serine O-phosphatidyltransferase